jgi:hypothetical protein
MPPDVYLTYFFRVNGPLRLVQVYTTVFVKYELH